MGLDINFFCAKRPAYEQLQKDIDEWADNEPVQQKTYEEMTEEEQERYNDWLTQRPDFDKVAHDCGQFRKVNFLLPFFCYEENCEDKEIRREELENLVSTCKKVLEAFEKRDNESDNEELWVTIAEKYLPTKSGFYFGSTDYDECYIDDVLEVKEWAEDLLTQLEEGDIVIMNCWW